MGSRMNSTFIPAVAKELVPAVMKTTVFGQVAKMFDGTVRGYGDTIKIHIDRLPSARAYTKYAQLTFDAVDVDNVDLRVDQAYYITQTIDELDNLQSPIAGQLMAKKTADMAYVYRNTMDAAMASLASSAGIAITNSGSAISITDANAFEYIQKAKLELLEADAPETAQSFIVVPPFYATKLLGPTSNQYTEKGYNMMANGQLPGNWAGFDKVLVSNNLTTYCLFGVVERSIGLAILKDGNSVVDASRPDYNEKAIKSSFCYGYGLIDAGRTGSIYVSEGSIS